MKAYPVGSYEEAHMFALRQFSRLSTAQKLRWLAEMSAFAYEANPAVRLRRLGIGSRRARKKRV